MSDRTYGQFCGLAAALDVIGERWSMLLVRNLLVGPQRFSDLSAGLPGLSTALLAGRLKALEAAGVVTKGRLPPPAASSVYELTDEGRRLAPAVLELARWGLDRLGASDGQHYDASSLAVGLWARLDDPPVPLIDGDIAVTVDGRPFGVRTDNGRSSVFGGAPSKPCASIAADSRTLAAISDGTDSVSDAMSQGRLSAVGNPKHIARLLEALGLSS
ncbi:winged helix-turn-helix transcriptional regulator [Tsukamurella tyrosinosolvens]|uniref:winged helix-turn-helix transcriptional regulator n=1 Tax=Tsukamurella tyrosinosolvens TaxID=57704 RepID=UPI002DD43B50|nr:helix-turn-helix domain-containing protein [Tsukamurella tyrosinosolvens]MEC4615524.1 helix-turn-helix domain-containing protein [Tsukamurella tyrosinosolvens]